MRLRGAKFDHTDLACHLDEERVRVVTEAQDDRRAKR